MTFSGIIRWLLLLTVLSGCAAPQKPMTPFRVAIEYHDKGEMTEYRRALERELKINPANLDARYDLALDLEQNGHTKAARKLYEQNLQKRWHFASAINLANLLHRQGQTHQAIAILQETAQRHPHEATPWYLLGEISVEQQQPDQAEEQFRQAINADPKNGFAHLRYAAFLAARNHDEQAVLQAKKAVELQPRCAPCWKTYGDILGQAGRSRDAVTAYQRSLALQPDSETRRQLIQALAAIGETVRAEHMRSALKALEKPSGHQ